MGWTKLDRYDYMLMTNFIRIKLSGRNDPDLVDIMSEINRSDGRIYVEGERYKYLDSYQIFSIGSKWYIELTVEEM